LSQFVAERGSLVAPARGAELVELGVGRLDPLRREVEPSGRLGHLGVMCEDLEAALEAAKSFGVAQMPQGRNWLRLPDGLAVELIQAVPPSAVAQALAVNPRAGA